MSALALAVLDPEGVARPAIRRPRGDLPGLDVLEEGVAAGSRSRARGCVR
ncbi:MAG TPA: hypothetical protein VH115_09750 [Solirubrobacteraceae bacterium]|nr:hypothetical protein [Solirubrobacteraceae bacterium]